MNLGVVITDQGLVAEATSLLRAAAERGWKLRCFLTDSGVHALRNDDIQELVRSEQTWLAVCELSVERYDMHVPETITDHVVVGGQYQDAELVRLSDRVAVF